MDRVKISESTRKSAKSMCSGKSFNHMTMLEGGAGQYAGNLAELCFIEWMDSLLIPHEYVADQKHGYDFSIGSQTFDIKAKLRNVECRPDYSAHVSLVQSDYKVDNYVFASIRNSQGVAVECELMGWIPKDQFWSDCQRVSSGDNVDGLIEREASGKMEYKNLNKMTDIVRESYKWS